MQSCLHLSRHYAMNVSNNLRKKQWFLTYVQLRPPHCLIEIIVSDLVYLRWRKTRPHSLTTARAGTAVRRVMKTALRVFMATDDVPSVNRKILWVGLYSFQGSYDYHLDEMRPMHASDLPVGCCDLTLIPLSNGTTVMPPYNASGGPRSIMFLDTRGCTLRASIASG
jgi:hypothetical protein